MFSICFSGIANSQTSASYYISLDNGMSTASFSAGGVYSSQLRWLISLNGGVILKENYSIGLRIGYSPAANLSINKNGGSADDFLFLAEFNYRIPLSNDWFLSTGLQSGVIRSMGSIGGSSEALAEKKWTGEYGLNICFEKKLSDTISTGIRSDLLLYRGATSQITGFWTLHI